MGLAAGVSAKSRWRSRSGRASSVYAARPQGYDTAAGMGADYGPIPEGLEVMHRLCDNKLCREHLTICAYWNPPANIAMAARKWLCPDGAVKTRFVHGHSSLRRTHITRPASDRAALTRRACVQGQSGSREPECSGSESSELCTRRCNGVWEPISGGTAPEELVVSATPPAATQPPTWVPTPGRGSDGGGHACVEGRGHVTGKLVVPPTASNVLVTGEAVSQN